MRLLILATLLIPTLAFAQVGTTTTSSTALPVGTFGSFWDAVVSGNWALAVGFGIMLVVWILRRTKVLDKVKLGSKWGIRFGVLILALLTAVAGGLVSGQSWFVILKTAVETAFAAVGGWEFIGKVVRDVQGGAESPPASEGGD